jgi:hypothetical protein
MQSANGKLAVLSVGLGAVTTTFITGTLMYRKGLTVPGGSVIEMAKIRVGRGKEKAYKKIKDIVPVAPMDSLEFAAWDIFEENAYLAAIHADVLKQKDMDPVREELEAIKPMKAAFDKLPLFIAARFNALLDDLAADDENSLAAEIPTGIKEGHNLRRLFADVTSGEFAEYLDLDGVTLLGYKLRLEDLFNEYGEKFETLFDHMNDAVIDGGSPMARKEEYLE